MYIFQGYDEIAMWLDEIRVQEFPTFAACIRSSNLQTELWSLKAFASFSCPVCASRPVEETCRYSILRDSIASYILVIFLRFDSHDVIHLVDSIIQRQSRFPLSRICFSFQHLSNCPCVPTFRKYRYFPRVPGTCFNLLAQEATTLRKSSIVSRLSMRSPQNVMLKSRPDSWWLWLRNRNISTIIVGVHIITHRSRINLLNPNVGNVGNIFEIN